MAVVLVFMPWGLFGRPPSVVGLAALAEAPPVRLVWQVQDVGCAVGGTGAVAAIGGQFPYAMVLMLDIMLAALFALSLHFMMGPGGMYSSVMAYFGLVPWCRTAVQHAGLAMDGPGLAP